MSENAVVKEVLIACAYSQIQVLDPSKWAKGTPPPYDGKDLAIQGIAWRNNTGALKSGRRFIRFGIPGSPDVLGMFRGGKIFGIECKTSSGRLSPFQKWWRALIVGLGGYYGVARSYEEASALIKGWKQEMAHD